MTSKQEKSNNNDQPDNRNTGNFYFDNNIPDTEIDALAAKAAIDLDHEIALARIHVKSILKDHPDNIDLLLRAISTVERLVRTRLTLSRYVPVNVNPDNRFETMDRFLNRLTGGQP
jgi:hypothetical protein